MVNNVLLDTLEEMGRGTAREIAERLRIEPFEALEMLREYQDAGEVEFLSGKWLLTGGEEQDLEQEPEVKEVPTPAVAPTPASTSANGMQKEIIRLLSQNGEMTTAGLAAEMNRHGQALSSHLRALEDNGMITKGNVKKKSSWRLLTQTQPQTLPELVSSEEIVETIPAFTATATATATATDATDQEQVQPPTVTTLPGDEERGSQGGQISQYSQYSQYSQEAFISRLTTRANQEKQYAIERVTKLSEVCEALSVLHKHQVLIQQLELTAEEWGGL